MDGVSSEDRDMYVSFIQEDLIEYEKNGQEVLEDIQEHESKDVGTLCKGQVNIKTYYGYSDRTSKRKRARRSVQLYDENNKISRNKAGRATADRISESERSGNLKEKFSLKEPVEETKEGNEKDSSQAAVNKLNGVRFSTKEPLGTQIDNVLSGADTNTTHVYVGKTFKVLKELGIKDMPMLITSEHVYSIIKTEEQAREEGKYKRKTNYHGLGKNQFLNTIERLQDPAFIIKSNTDDADTRIVLVTNAMDNEGHYIVGAIRPNGYGTIENKKD